MYRALISLTASLLFAFVMHALPPATDSFRLADFGGKQIKVFPRGWPFCYVLEGEMRDSLLAIALKLLANVVIGALAVYILTHLWGKVRGRSTNRRPN